MDIKHYKELCRACDADKANKKSGNNVAWMVKSELHDLRATADFLWGKIERLKLIISQCEDERSSAQFKKFLKMYQTKFDNLPNSI